ncbi:PREDICTED: heparanase-like protein 3 [Tarenaya hassleriana]|uniref:heparanase-like protein 3 n=1 Tax=Tarenaya hassleriana TaxID=28532 RepID=UPI00053C1E9B|nr:PREDICTED: heparanase-like protein 3 [Tarenaya hassleriana]
MGSRRIWQMGLFLWVFVLAGVICSGESSSVDSGVGTVYVDGRAAVGRTDSDFVCATLDWWPPEKCDYGTCSWDHASLLNLDLSNNILQNAIKAFAPLKIRLGGTLQDIVVYETPELKQPCVPFTRNSSVLFGFTEGCLPMRRWDEINAFFQRTGAEVVFGLNALSGRKVQPDGSAVGAWDYTNAESFIRYTAQKNYTIHGWELGNELCGNGVGARVSANQYALDTIALGNIVNRVYKDVSSKPMVIGPGGFFDASWFKEYLDKTVNSLDAATHHIYNLGPGVDDHLVEKILDPSYLDGEANTFRSLRDVIKSSPTKAAAWVGEAGGAYNSGHNLVSNAFVYSFWYLDQLGMSSLYDTKTYCRQSLVGGNYGLLNTTNFTPNPDYYSALLWHRLMGRNALFTSFSGSKKIRSYTHCAKQSKGITVLLMNLDNTTTVQARVEFNGSSILRHTVHHRHGSKSSRKRAFPGLPRPWVSKGLMGREEYHLTPKDGDLHSQSVLLNGNVLSVSPTGEMPSLEPRSVSSTDPITVSPLSIVFVHMPNVVAPACS